MRKLIISILLIIINISVFAQANIDSLRLVIKNSTSDSIIINTYIEIADNFTPENNEFLDNYLIAYKLAQKKELKYEQYQSAFNIGKYYNFKDNYDSAFYYFEISLNGFKSINNFDYQAAVLGEMGNSYCFRSNYEKCLDCYLQAVEVIEQLGNDIWLGIAKNNIGNVYYYLSDDDLAMEYYLEAYKIFKKIESPDGIALSTNNIGGVFAEKGQIDSALHYFEIALKISEEIGYNEQIAETSVNLAKLYDKLEQYEKAIEYYKKAVKITEKIGDLKGASLTYLALGTHYLNLKNFQQAELFFKKTLEISTEIGDLHTQMSAYKDFSELDSTKGDYLNALENYKKYNELKDSIYQLESNEQILEMQTKFDTEKKEKENLLLKEQHEKQELVNQRQKIFIFSGTIALILIFAIAILLLYSNKMRKKTNTELAIQYNEISTQKEEILMQNEILNQQKEEITAQRDEISEQRNIVTEQNKKMTYSIIYAKRIQQAVLPSTMIFKQKFSNFFIFYKPKDIVSGDFYWAKNTENLSYIAVSDCTGHGVPGAFMSMLGITLINEIINKFENIEPNKILDELRIEIKKALKQETQKQIVHDGMDISFCMINWDKKELQYAGAYRPLYILKNNQLTEIKGNRQPISSFVKERAFTNHSMAINKKDKFYMFTDGFADQLGGSQNKKYMSSKFKSLIKNIGNLDMEQQKQLLENEFETWKSSQKQIDDILVVGFEI